MQLARFASFAALFGQTILGSFCFSSVSSNATHSSATANAAQDSNNYSGEEVVTASLNVASSDTSTATNTTNADGTPLVPRMIEYRVPVTWYVMGDAPYSSEDRARLPDQVKAIPSNADFVVHVGDMKGVDKCASDGPYQLVSDAFLKFSDAPVFLTPGDNDYYDCDAWKVGWERWTNHFLHFHDKFNKGWSVHHQPGREENFAFRRRGVLFIGVHTVGAQSGVKNKNEWEKLLKDDLDWTREHVMGMSHKVVVILTHAHPTSHHNTYLDGLSELAKADGKPFLYIHGDSHRWRKDRPFVANNILRVIVDQGGLADPVKVTVDLNGDEPAISFHRRSLTKRFLRAEGQ